MFPRAFFALRYFAARYFGLGGASHGTGIPPLMCEAIDFDLSIPMRPFDLQNRALNVNIAIQPMQLNPEPARPYELAIMPLDFRCT